MPSYNFENTDGSIEVHEMKIAELDDFKQANPHLTQILSQLWLADPVRLGITPPPADFQKYVLGRIKHSVPEASVENRWTLAQEV